MYLVTFHGVANLTPTVSGTDYTVAGWPIGNVCTFNPNKRTKYTASAPNTQFYVWDRGSAAKSINGFMMAGHGIGGLGFDVYSGASSPPGTSRYTTGSAPTGPFLVAAACGTDRYVGVEFEDNGGSAAVIGFVSFCKYHDLGNAQLGTTKGGASQFNAASFPGIREGGATVQATFARVARSTALTIADEIGQVYGGTALSTQQNVVGHAGGAHPIALWDPDASRLWYGPGTIQITEAMPGYSVVNVSVTEYPVGNTL